MSSTVVAPANPNVKSAGYPAPEKDRRGRRRAKMSAQVHIRAVNSPEPFQEVCMTVDVSRDGLLFTSNFAGYWKGQRVDIAFPYSSAATAINQGYPADVVRVQKQPGGKNAVAVHFLAAQPAERTEKKSVYASSDVVPDQRQSVVLAVEPDQRSADSMRSMIEQDGYTVVIVPTAQAALDILRTTVPSVFIGEVEAEDMSGQDLCVIIKQNERLRNVPVILLTRSAQPADYSASHQLGAVICMAKPFKLERLQQVVRLVAPPPALHSAYGVRLSGSVDRTIS
ncbi:MAG TPA: response regulator [Candidatus Acidoferrales bacterium]|nr:response regulator [Candidatus Acidoferrales bacterium]